MKKNFSKSGDCFEATASSSSSSSWFFIRRFGLRFFASNYNGVHYRGSGLLHRGGGGCVRVFILSKH